MREYCPLCEKNGIKTKIGCYQINWEEAIFMCSSVECPWPMELEDTLIIQRPIKIYKTKDALEEVANKYFKKEDDPSNAFLSAYTPPQTPEVLLKDTANSSSQVPCPIIVPKCTSTSLDVVEDTMFNTDNILLDVSKSCDKGIENPSIKITISSIKPKLVDTKSVNYEVKKMPIQNYVFNSSSNLHSKTNVKLESKDEKVCNNSFVDNSVVIKTEQCDSRLVDKVKPKLRIVPRFKTKAPLQKFSFEDYKKKSESSKVKTEIENNLSTAIKIDNLDNNQTIVNITESTVSKANLLNSHTPDVKPIDSPIILPDIKNCQDDVDIDFSEFFVDSNVNLNANENMVKNESVIANQSDIDSILTSLSSDSHNVDMEQSDLDELRSYFDSLGDFSL